MNKCEFRLETAGRKFAGHSHVTLESGAAGFLVPGQGRVMAGDFVCIRTDDGREEKGRVAPANETDCTCRECGCKLSPFDSDSMCADCWNETL